MKLKEQFSVIGTKNSGPRLTSFIYGLSEQKHE